MLLTLSFSCASIIFFYLISKRLFFFSVNLNLRLFQLILFKSFLFFNAYVIIDEYTFGRIIDFVIDFYLSELNTV
jgi:hypothetical protein